MSQDKRRNPRIDFLLQVMIIGQPGLHRITDFSLSGLFIKVKNPSRLKEGDKIDLIMKLPEENDFTHIKARVVRVTTEGIGVEFEDMPPKGAMALEYCFHVFKHTVPIPGS